MSHDWQSADEIEAHFADGGPLMAARRWLTAVLTVRDLAAAWAGVDPEFRLALAQRALWAHRDDPEIAGYDLEGVALELAAGFPEHELWPSVCETILDDLGSRWPWLDLETLGAASRPRMVALGYELVILAPGGSDGSVVNLDEPAASDEILELLMHHQDGRWLVAGIGSDALPAPRWPPRG